jgi:hypothetical protein
VEKSRKHLKDELGQELQDLFKQYGEKPYLSVSNRPFVERRIQEMKLEFDSLLEKFSSIEAYPMQDIIEEYCSKYPSQSFSNWFVKWGQNLLRIYQKLRRDHICGASKDGKLEKRILFPPHQPPSNDAPPKRTRIQEQENRDSAEIERVSPLPIAVTTPQSVTVPQVDMSQDQSLILPIKNVKKRGLGVNLHTSKKRNKRVERSNCEEKVVAAVPQESKVEDHPSPFSQEVVEVNNDGEFRREECGIVKSFVKEVWQIFSPCEM